MEVCAGIIAFSGAEQVIPPKPSIEMLIQWVTIEKMVVFNWRDYET